MVKKDRGKSPPRIPPSGYMRVTPGETIWSDTTVEEYPKGKKCTEFIIAAKWVSHLNMTGIIENRVPPDADVIYREATPEGEIVIPIELMELVHDRDIHLRVESERYARELQQDLDLGKLSLSFSCEEQIRIPDPSKPKGKVLLKEIREAILGSNTGEMLATGEILFGSVGNSKTGNYLNSKLNKDTGKVVQIFFSIDGMPIGLQYAPTEEEWSKWEEKLKHKYLRDYSIKSDSALNKSQPKEPILLLHGSHARPNFSRLSTIIGKLQKEQGNRFSEVWYLKPYPEGMDDVRLIYPEQLDNSSTA